MAGRFDDLFNLLTIGNDVAGGGPPPAIEPAMLHEYAKLYSFMSNSTNAKLTTFIGGHAVPINDADELTNAIIELEGDFGDGSAGDAVTIDAAAINNIYTKISDRAADANQINENIKRICNSFNDETKRKIDHRDDIIDAADVSDVAKTVDVLTNVKVNDDPADAGAGAGGDIPEALAEANTTALYDLLRGADADIHWPIPLQFCRIYLYLKGKNEESLKLEDADFDGAAEGEFKYYLKLIRDGGVVLNSAGKLQTIITEMDNEVNADATSPISRIPEGTLAIIFTLLNEAGAFVVNMKTLINSIINDTVRTDPIIDAGATDEAAMIEILFKIRGDDAAGPSSPPPSSPPPPLQPPLAPAATKIYKIIAEEEVGGNIKIYANNVDVTTKEYTDIAASSWVTINPNETDAADKLSKTIMYRNDQINNEFKQFTNRSIYSYKLGRLGLGTDPILGTVWGSGYRSPVYNIDTLSSSIPAANNYETKTDIRYFSRNVKDIVGDQITLYQYATITKTKDNSTDSLVNIRRLDDFIKNVEEISKIRLKAKEPVYMLSYEQRKAIGQGAGPCDYMNIILTLTEYDSNLHKPSKTNADRRCTEGLWTGPLYKPAFDKMIEYVKANNPNNSADTNNVLGQIFGGARKSRGHIIIQNPFSLTKHKRHRYTKNNNKRKRYNMTKKM